MEASKQKQKQKQMTPKQMTPKPRLDRRNAMKHINYDASTSPSSSSSSFDDHQFALRTRSLDVSPLSNQTSFRIEGIFDGEFDLICRRLGLSGPEDFAIPADAWEARRVLSPSDNLHRSRLRSVEASPKEEGDVLLVRFDGGISTIDKVIEQENGCLEFKNGSNFVRKIGGDTCVDLKSVGVERTRNGGGGIKGVRPPNLAPPPVIMRSVVVLDGGVSTNDEVVEQENGCLEFRNGSNLVREIGGDERVDLKSVVVERTRNGGRGIKGVRPPNLAPPPVIMRSVVVDDVSSTWDICRSFGPDDDDQHSNSVEEDVKLEEKEVIDIAIAVQEQELDDDDDDDCVSSMVVQIYSNISPNGIIRHSIKSWQKGDFLGSGSFGTVYEGYTDNGLFFAVKEVSLLDQGIQGQQSIHQLEQEISLLSQFEHENIVQYLGTEKDEARLYIFLELVTKGSLASLYQKYTLRDSQVSAYTRQILNGLKYLHERNVVHRDIKCANILVDASGSVKLADFGLAKATKLNDVKSCKGTAFWMAPEVVNRKKNGYGLAADIWSLGCTVLEMLTRQIPYSHLEGMQALFRIGKGDPPPVPNSLSTDARDFILKCLQVNPDNRPTAAQLLEHSFVKRSLQANSSPASPHYNVTQHRSGSTFMI